MTQEITRMAREAGINSPDCYKLTVGHMSIETLERFAALVAAAERNKLAQWMIAQGYATGHGDTTEDLLKELEWQVRESEREACAKVCDNWPNARDDVYEIGVAIRARGKA